MHLYEFAKNSDTTSTSTTTRSSSRIARPSRRVVVIFAYVLGFISLVVLLLIFFGAVSVNLFDEADDGAVAEAKENAPAASNTAASSTSKSKRINVRFADSYWSLAKTAESTTIAGEKHSVRFSDATTPAAATTTPVFSRTPHEAQFNPDCEKVAGDDFLRRIWKQNRRLVCEVPFLFVPVVHNDSNTGNHTNKASTSNTNSKGATTTATLTTRVHEHLLNHLDARPTIRTFENVFLESWTGQVLAGSTGCPKENTVIVAESGDRLQPEWAGASLTKDQLEEVEHEAFVRSPSNVTVFSVHRFMLGNPFEAMHGYINTYLAMRTLNLIDEQQEHQQQQPRQTTAVQFVFTDTLEPTPRDDEMWRSFSLGKVPPIYRYTGTERIGRDLRVLDTLQRRGTHEQHLTEDMKVLAKHEPRLVFVPRLVWGPTTGVSILVSSAAPLHGRGRDHFCASSLMQNATRWMRRNFERMGILPVAAKIIHPQQPTDKVRRRRIEVIWCSRSIHPRAGGKLLFPHRTLHDETRFVLALRQALGPDVHLRVVDFGRIPHAADNIRAVETAQVTIGFHGAGLAWASFMQPSNGAIIELFGGDRTSDNRHYANLASLMDFHHVQFDTHRAWRPVNGARDWWSSAGGIEPNYPPLQWRESDVDEIARLFFDELPWQVKPRRGGCGDVADAPHSASPRASNHRGEPHFNGRALL